MKCIGRKYEEIVIWYVFLWILFAFSVTGLIFYDNEARIVFLIPVLFCVGFLAYYSYLVFFIPYEIVLYDEENKLLKVYITRWKVKTIPLSEIKSIKLNTFTHKSYWFYLNVVLKNGEEFTTTCIDKDNEIMESITVIKE